jgi:hypothetical protein
MSLTDTEWVDRLREQVEVPAVDVDVPGAVRRGRRRRTTRRTAAVLVPVAVLAAAVVVWPPQSFLPGPQLPAGHASLAPLAPPAQPAFVASPLATLTGAGAEASTSACRDMYARSAQFRGENTLPGMQPADVPALAPVVVQQREKAAVTVLASSDWLAVCLWRVDGHGGVAGDQGGISDELRATPAPDAVDVLGYYDEQFAGVRAGLLLGRYGADVTSVQVSTGHGDPVVATLADGILLAWWPTDGAEDAEVVARLADGRTVSQVVAAPNAAPEG